MAVAIFLLRCTADKVLKAVESNPLSASAFAGQGLANKRSRGRSQRYGRDGEASCVDARGDELMQRLSDADARGGLARSDGKESKKSSSGPPSMIGRSRVDRRVHRPREIRACSSTVAPDPLSRGQIVELNKLHESVKDFIRTLST